jgi:hypothetical protein
MRTVNIWSKLYLHSTKVSLLLAFIFCLAGESHAQQVNWLKRKNPNYDNKRLTYGFLIGLHSSTYQIKYSDRFVTPQFDTLYSVEPDWSAGFSLGFIVNYRLADLLDVRLTPTVAFYENKLTYRFTDDAKNDETIVETTMVEFPVLLKFKSERRENLRMYMIGGVKPGFEASGKKGIEKTETTLEVKNINLSLDVGFGLDIYYPLFKFSPEIRFSRGITDVLANRNNKYGAPLERVNTNTINVYLIFQ